MDDTPILHHFDLSPFAEKIRLILGCKQLRWHSVQIPMLMPKPDVVALTGGYRRTPILQIGADIWCDTALIARELDRRAGPPLFPPELPLATALAQWADRALFWSVIDFASQPACVAHRFGHLTAEERGAIAADRDPFRAGVPKLSPADAGASLRCALADLDRQLAVAGPHLLGRLCIADFSVAHCLWHLRRAGPPAQALLAPFRRLLQWHDGLLALGHGQPEDLSSGQALARAVGAGGHTPATVVAESGLARGASVTVAATDYGREPSTGILVGLSDEEVVIERMDPRAGTVHVHFPRVGFRVEPAAAA